jgi:hypothetical protein
LKLEKIGCECGMDWRRNYIIIFSILMIILSCFEAYITINHQNPMSVLRPIRVYLMPLYIGLTVLYIISTFQYVWKLKKAKCNCAEDIAQVIMFMVAAIDTSVFVIIGLMLLIGMIAFISK